MDDHVIVPFLWWGFKNNHASSSICSVWGTRTRTRVLIPRLFLVFVTKDSLGQIKLFPLRKQRPEAFCRQMEVFRITKEPEMVEVIRKVELSAWGSGLGRSQLARGADPSPTASGALWAFALSPPPQRCRAVKWAMDKVTRRLCLLAGN